MPLINMEISALDQKQKQQFKFNSLSHWNHNLLHSLKMNRFAYVGQKLLLLFRYSCHKTASLLRFSQALIVYLYRFIVSQVHPFFIHLGYFVIISLLGYLALKVSKPRTYFPVWPYNDLGLFFTSVSASTLSGLSVMEMEIFSNNQLIIITILMLLGGEVFTSMLGLVFSWFNNFLSKHKNGTTASYPNSTTQLESQIHELDIASDHISQSDSDESQIKNYQVTILNLENGNMDMEYSLNDLKHNSTMYLGCVVLSYMILVIFVGCILVFTYLSIVPSAKEVLRNKDLKIQTFSVFTVVSTFANCGFVPTNENMMVLKKNTGLLLLLIPFALVGNTLYPPCLRLVIWTLGKYTKREEFFYMLKNHRDMGYYPLLLSGFHCCQLAITVFLLLATQLLLFCSLEWNSENLKGLHFHQKLVALLFQTVNSRHAGESVLDLSTVSSAMLVLVIVMMYLPPYTRFLPIRDDVDVEGNNNNNTEKDKKRSSNRTKCLVDSVVLSQMSYIAIFIILICITERDKLRRDPLNFNLLTVTTEVIGAYGNVGFSTGYNCERQLEPDVQCKHHWTGLAARCSSEGKATLIAVMFFGKLKKFSRNGGRQWLLS